MNENIADDNYISLICNGEFNAIPDFKIGELFESFFDNINYNVVKKDEEVYVDFSGEAICDDEPCTVIIRFRIEKNVEDFEIDEIKVNDEILSECETLDLLEDIAYVGGAVMEEDNDYYCSGCESGDCTNCSFEDDIDDEDNYEGYDFEENDEEDDDDENDD